LGDPGIGGVLEKPTVKIRRGFVKRLRKKDLITGFCDDCDGSSDSIKQGFYRSTK